MVSARSRMEISSSVPKLTGSAPSLKRLVLRPVLDDERARVPFKRSPSPVRIVSRAHVDRVLEVEDLARPDAVLRQRKRGCGGLPEGDAARADRRAGRAE